MNRLINKWQTNLLVLVLALTCLATGLVSAQTQAQDEDQEQLQPDATADDNQGFALFESIENASSRATTAPVRRNSRQSRATVAEPEFTLLGTSRIGDKYSAIIQHKDGEAIVVKAAPATTTPIPEHDDYSIINVAPGTVSVRYPGNTACVEFAEKGVSCNAAGNTAVLALATGEALAPSKAEQIFAVQLVDEAVAEEPENAPDGGAENRFSPRRIAPEDVPPGMRVVSTPFGDRLVEQ